MFLLSEDRALKAALKGMTVNDQRSTEDDLPRPVRVFYGQPDQELRPQDYPYITIDHLGISRDPEREMRGYTNSVLAPYLAPSDLEETKDWKIHLPIPVMIDYQITTYARQPRHDIEIIAQLMYQKLPLRFGQLSLDDGTYRRLEVLDLAKRDSTEQAKRLYVNAVTVRISSEISQDQASEIYKVNNVIITEPTIINYPQFTTQI
jgi:hypothetical protein